MVVTVLAAIVSLLLVYKYKATATMLPPNPNQEAMFGLMSGFLPGSFTSSFSSALGGMISGISTPSDLYASIMQSTRIKREIIAKYNLREEFDTKTMHDTYEALDGITEIDISPEGIISVSITYKNKVLATDIANSYVEELDKFNTETAMTTGKKYRIFIEERLRSNEDSLAAVEESLRAFQEKHHTVALEAEIEGAIAAIAELKSEMILLEVQKAAIGSGNQNNPHVRKINQQLWELRRQLAKIEFGDTTVAEKGFGAGFAVPFSELPEVAIEYARLVRDVEVQSAIFEILTQQYEQAKLMEAKDTPTVQFLDRASVPEKRAFPKRTLIVVLTFLITLLINIPLIFLLEYLGEIKKNPQEHAFAVGITREISTDLTAFKRLLKKISRIKRH
jgi:uncharacterized protein involved in exopolysaccharide biosynthesis